MKLLIVIPALNEQGSIENIILRSLSAKEKIIRGSPVDEVEITVVSDGSTDRTVEIASSYKDKINVMVFEKNRGYGAAIKGGWENSDADLLGFLDADGTCDPDFFKDLCNVLIRDHADVALGCRMNKSSKMPLTRKIGNRIFSILLSFFSDKKIRDTASGMRVVRKASLPKLMPLPDGLHFTPAMSARAALSKDLNIVEIDMPYNEREGRSKLQVVKDGLRFLSVILKTTFLYRPSRPLTSMGVFFGITAFLLMAKPTLYYFRNGFVLEWMIYRFIVSHLLGALGVLFICGSYVSSRMVAVSLSSASAVGMTGQAMGRFFRSGIFWMVPVMMVLSGAYLVMPSLFELIHTGATYEHWSRFIAMSFLFLTAFILITTRVIDFIITLISERLEYLRTLIKQH